MRYRRPWLWLSPRTRRAVRVYEAAAAQEAEYRAAVQRILEARNAGKR